MKTLQRSKTPSYPAIALIGILLLLSSLGAKEITTKFGYDENGNLNFRRTNDGETTDYIYDDVDRLTGIEYSNGETVALTYNSFDQITQLEDATGTTEYQYIDPFHKLLSVHLPNGHSIIHLQSKIGRRTKTSTDTSTGESYTYDQEGRIHRVFTDFGVTTYNYNPNTGQLSSRRLANGITIEYDYYAQTGELYSIYQYKPNGEQIASYSYSYYPNGRISQVVEGLGDTTKIVDYEYDDLFRLKSVTTQKIGVINETREEEYQYDPNGNRTRRTLHLNGEVQEDNIYHYCGINEIRSINKPGEVFFYDDLGNIVTRINAETKTQYTWGVESRLLKVQIYDNRNEEAHLKTVAFTYNGLGQRVKRTLTLADGTEEVTEYVNDTSPVYQPYDIHKGDQSTHFFRESSAYIEDGQTRFMLSGIGGVARVVDANCQEIVTLEYDSFGNVISGDSSKTYQGYRGEDYDEDIGLIFLRNRFYDPKLGRFLSIDAHPGFLTQPQTLNPYLYVHNDPINYIDPTGLCEEEGGVLSGLLDLGQTGISVVGLSPLVGNIADGVNAGISFSRGNILDGTIDLSSAMLGAGQFAGVAAIINRGGRGFGKITDGVKSLFNNFGAKKVPTTKWPKTAAEMDDLLDVPGKKIPDGPTTPGRNKTEWRPNKDTKITHEQHPYHPDAPDWHKNEHWHLDTPDKPHKRYLPGDNIPGYE